MGRPRPGPGDGVAERVAAAVRARTDLVPAAALVLGSGLGDALRVARELAGAEDEVEVAYGELPGFPPPSVPGHAGRLWLGRLGGRPLACFQGRVHYYEGHGMALASITARVAAELGARAVILSAAAGGVDPSVPGGAIVVLRDHLNLMGENPLRGWRMPDGTPAFVDLSQVYDPELTDAAVAAARAALGAGAVREGVYAALPGPSYETPAEVEFLRRAGATVVGMSVVPEAVAARALGLRVVGISFVTNAAGTPVSHEEVLRASARAADAIGRVTVELLRIL
jgi:purine-nucleoside phosphorylase